MTRLRSALLALLLAPAGLPAQPVVVGTVMDGASRQPVTGAMVRLLEPDGVWTGRMFLTAADGRFRLRAPGPGTYRLRVERIGFEEATAGPVILEADATLTYDVPIGARPVRLEGLDVSAGRRRCTLESDAEGATQALWDEVRKALDAARWTEREAGLRFEVVRRTVRLDPRGERALEEDRRGATLFGGNSVRTLPPEDLAEGGYVRQEDPFIYHYGPDAAVLLSDAFLETHCFRLVEGPEDEPGLVGLEFEPVRGQNPDITGVLWADRTTARLERVEFAYTGLGRRPGADLARGEVHFTELSDGRWIVRDWFIRAPLLGLARQFVAGVLRERVVVDAVQEQGSEVVEASGEEVSWRADVPWGGVRGVVWDSVAGRALAGAEVTLGGRVRVTRSDDEGRFLIPDVAPATYRVAFEHPVLGELEVPPPSLEVRVLPDSAVVVDLAVPSLGTVLASRCRGRALVVGTVTDGVAVAAGAVVTAAPAGGVGGEAFTAVSDDAGRYWLCGSATAGPLLLEARLGDRRSAPVEVEVPGGAWAVRDLALPPAGGRASSPAAGASGTGRTSP